MVVTGHALDDHHSVRGIQAWAQANSSWQVLLFNRLAAVVLCCSAML